MDLTGCGSQKYSPPFSTDRNTNIVRMKGGSWDPRNDWLNGMSGKRKTTVMGDAVVVSWLLPLVDLRSPC